MTDTKNIQRLMKSCFMVCLASAVIMMDVRDARDPDLYLCNSKDEGKSDAFRALQVGGPGRLLNYFVG